jgi:hypothetical protein
MQAQAAGCRVEGCALRAWLDDDLAVHRERWL